MMIIQPSKYCISVISWKRGEYVDVKKIKKVTRMAIIYENSLLLTIIVFGINRRAGFVAAAAKKCIDKRDEWPATW